MYILYFSMHNIQTKIITSIHLLHKISNYKNSHQIKKFFKKTKTHNFRAGKWTKLQAVTISRQHYWGCFWFPLSLVEPRYLCCVSIPQLLSAIMLRELQGANSFGELPYSAAVHILQKVASGIQLGVGGIKKPNTLGLR